jgi:LmbE family N-acetylglucosaminyl deacetylase
MASSSSAAPLPLTGRRVLVVAPHPDDETLGCGGTLLRHKREGAELSWLIATEMTGGTGYSAAQIDRRNKEIEHVAAALGFASVHRLGLATTWLDTLPLGYVVGRIKGHFDRIGPDVVYVPFVGDAHSDHSVVARAVAAVAKWFRAPSLRRMLAYEALSETGFALTPDAAAFAPDCFVDIGGELARKLEILELFADEIRPFPFPRSREAVTALARWRGASAGVAAAEAFVTLQERVA